MQDCETVLLRARRDDEVRQRHSVFTAASEEPLNGECPIKCLLCDGSLGEKLSLANQEGVFFRSPGAEAHFEVDD
jgi:hypothetical protein